MFLQQRRFSNFSRTIQTQSLCFRADNEWQIPEAFNQPMSSNILARGLGLSYSDCCVNDGGLIVDCSRLNHLLSFDELSGLLYCQAGVTFADLFSVHADYIPPVIPGTLQASLAGGVANDVHGKNNHQEGSLGRHIQWLEIQTAKRVIRCSRDRHAELFTATLGGLGLTGIIRRVAIKLRKASRTVEEHSEKHQDLGKLLVAMQDKGTKYDYQVAWLDLLNPFCAILSQANHCPTIIQAPKRCYPVPALPFSLISAWGMRQFNRYYFNHKNLKTRQLPLSEFNNPLDSIKNWNRLYGKRGFLQFQAVFDAEDATQTITQLTTLINSHGATPTLTVLKYFTQPGSGLLSFVKPGFTIAIDFINNNKAKSAICQMNQLISELGGRVYLAKDLLLTPQQFVKQYPYHDRFKQLLQDYECNMQSNMSRRLGLVKS